jgi:hypothetical protein
MACYKFYPVRVLPANHLTHDLALVLGESGTTTSSEEVFSAYMFRILITIFSRTLLHFRKQFFLLNTMLHQGSEAVKKLTDTQ